MTRSLVVVCLLATAFAALANDTDTVDAATGLIKAPGWEDVRAHCGGCPIAVVTDDVDAWAARMVALHRDHGLRILGGCCGTGRAHLEGIVRRLSARPKQAP